MIVVKLSIQSTVGIAYFDASLYWRPLWGARSTLMKFYIGFPLSGGESEIDVSELNVVKSALGSHYHDCQHYYAEGTLSVSQDVNPWSELVPRLDATSAGSSVFCTMANSDSVESSSTKYSSSYERYVEAVGRPIWVTETRTSPINCTFTIDPAIAWLYLTTDDAEIGGIPAKSIGRESVCFTCVYDVWTSYPAWTGLSPTHDSHSVSSAVYALSELRNRLYSGLVDPVYNQKWFEVHGAEPDMSGLVNQIRYATLMRIKRHSEEVMRRLDGDDASFSRLTYQAADSVRLLNINSISFISEGIDFIKQGGFRPQLEEARDLDRTLKSGKKLTQKLAKTLKTSASLYLGNHYGTRLSARDSVEIVEGAMRLSNEYLNARQTMSKHAVRDYFLDNGQTHYTCVRRIKSSISSLSDESRSVVVATDNLVRRAYEADILPTAANIWDLVPYSFVVDWFIPIGNYLEDVETGHYMATLHPYEVFESTKITGSTAFDYVCGGNRVTGTLSTKAYFRECRDTFNTETPVVEDAGGFNMQHGIESSALIISRFG